MLHLIKKLFLSCTRFSNLTLQRRSFTVFSTDICILFSCFFSSLVSVSEKRNIETMLTVPYSYNWQKFNNNMNEKEANNYKSYSGAYCETILWFEFCTNSKILICFNLIKRFPKDLKRYSSHLQVPILHRVAPIKVYVTIHESLKISYLKKVFKP